MTKYSINSIVNEFKNLTSCDYHPKFFVGILEQLEGREIGLDEDLSQLVDKHWDTLWKNIIIERYVPDVAYFMLPFTDDGCMDRVLKKNLKKVSKNEILTLLDSGLPLYIKNELFIPILSVTKDEDILVKLASLEWMDPSEVVEYHYIELMEEVNLSETVLSVMKDSFVKNVGIRWYSMTYTTKDIYLKLLNSSITEFVMQFNNYVSDRGYEHLKIDMNEVESMRGELPPVASNFPKLELYNETKVLMEAAGISEDMQDKMGLTSLFNHANSFD